MHGHGPWIRTAQARPPELRGARQGADRSTVTDGSTVTGGEDGRGRLALCPQPAPTHEAWPGGFNRILTRIRSRI